MNECGEGCLWVACQWGGSVWRLGFGWGSAYYCRSDNPCLSIPAFNAGSTYRGSS